MNHLIQKVYVRASDLLPDRGQFRRFFRYENADPELLHTIIEVGRTYLRVIVIASSLEDLNRFKSCTPLIKYLEETVPDMEIVVCPESLITIKMAEGVDPPLGYLLTKQNAAEVASFAATQQGPECS